MDIREALVRGTGILNSDTDIQNPAFEAGVLLCEALGKDRLFIYTNSSLELAPGDSMRYFEMVRQRASGVPLQYITGHQEFMSLDFRVTKDVLIPRQDTETLVEEVIAYLHGRRCERARILDLGTGSGCIAVSLAHFLPGSLVTAADISSGALSVARTNAENAGVEGRMTFIHGDLFNALRSCRECSQDGGQTQNSGQAQRGGQTQNNGQAQRGGQYQHGERPLFDVIVSNPPYIPSGDICGLQKEVACFEPQSALDGGGDGLDFYRRIAAESPEFLKAGGLLALEVGIGQADDVALLLRHGFRDIKITKDLGGIERVVTGNLL